MAIGTTKINDLDSCEFLCSIQKGVAAYAK